MKGFKASIVMVALLSTGMIFAQDNLLMVNNSKHDLAKEVMSVELDPVGFSAKSQALLEVAMNNKGDNVCLYQDSQCTRAPRCANVNTQTLATNHPLRNGNLTIGFNDKKVEQLAMRQGGQVKNYRCLQANLHYRLQQQSRHEKLLAISRQEQLRCQLHTTAKGKHYAHGLASTCVDHVAHLLINQKIVARKA